MRIWWGCLLALVVTDALAAPPKRKDANPKYPYKALKSFIEATEYERAGLVRAALDEYRDSLRESPQPATQFNVARMELELGDTDDAVRSFQAYLDLAPSAPDAAAIKKLVEELSATTSLTIGSSSTSDGIDAFVLVDGDVIGSSPVVVHPKPGKHFVERISATDWGGKEVDVKAGVATYSNVMGRRNTRSGNVLISHSGLNDVREFTEGTLQLALFRHVKVPVGKLTTKLAFNLQDGLCSAIVIDVKSITELTYVRVDVGKLTRPSESEYMCYPVTRVRTHRLPLRAP